MSSKMWLASRVALALGLMVSFYVLAIGLSAFLLRPFSEIKAVADSKTVSADWRARCAALGIADVRLAA